VVWSLSLSLFNFHTRPIIQSRKPTKKLLYLQVISGYIDLRNTTLRKKMAAQATDALAKLKGLSDKTLMQPKVLNIRE